MRNGPELIKATKVFAVDSTVRSWWCLVSTACLLVVALVGTLVIGPLAGRLGCSVLAGFLILRMFVIYHDQQHHAILPRSRLAEGLMRVFGILVLSPSSVWRSSHNYHHNHNSKLRSAHIGSFPVMTKAQYLVSSRSERLVYLFTRHPLTILYGYVFIFLHGMCLYPLLNQPRKSLDCLAALLLHGAIAAGLILFWGWPAWLLAQVVPHFVASAIGSYLFYAQHNFPSVTFADRAGWTYEKAALESSSHMETGPLMAWFTGNIGFHHIHHLNARIPFYRLPEVYRAMPELQRAKTTSLHPLEILRCLRLKVWDVENQRMVPVPQPVRHS
jgi:omega-6 fatty acid desaturase (delta-12 desaturase)